jgi:UDP-glucose 4-epimerase
MAAAQDGAQILNVCTGHGTSVRELADAVASLYGRAPVIRFAPARTADIRVSVGDPGAAIAQLGIAATTRLQDGLRRLVVGDG